MYKLWHNNVKKVKGQNHENSSKPAKLQATIRKKLVTVMVITKVFCSQCRMGFIKRLEMK